MRKYLAWEGDVLATAGQSWRKGVTDHVWWEVVATIAAVLVAFVQTDGDPFATFVWGVAAAVVLAILIGLWSVAIAPYRLHARREDARLEELGEHRRESAALRSHIASLEERAPPLVLEVSVSRVIGMDWLDAPSKAPPGERRNREDMCACRVRGFRVVNRSAEAVDLAIFLHGDHREGGNTYQAHHRWSIQDKDRWWDRMLQGYPADDYFPPDHSFTLEPNEASRVGTLTFCLYGGHEGEWDGAIQTLRIQHRFRGELVCTPDIPLDREADYWIDTSAAEPVTLLRPRVTGLTRWNSSQ